MNNSHWREVIERAADTLQDLGAPLNAEELRRLATPTPQSGGAEVPSHEAIADMLPSMLLNGSTTCPLCGTYGVHEHAPAEIVIYRNGMKYGRRLSAPASPQGVSEDEMRVAFERWVTTVWRPDDGEALLRKSYPAFAFAAWKAALTAAGAAPEGYYLASFKHESRQGVLWWGPNNSGYTPDLDQAGIYTELTPGYHDSDHTVPVPVALIRSLRVRRVIDPGDSLNGAFNSVQSLRKWIAATPNPGAQHGQEVMRDDAAFHGRIGRLSFTPAGEGGERG